ncbi:hypothetical protein D4R49_00515 [bacterium]|nr:MAG: hypothetical protein D4R49_00515 [bacterium]
MSTVLEQAQRPAGEVISWEDVVKQVADSTSGRKVIQTKNRKTGLLRHGILSDAHFKIPGLLIMFGLDEEHVAQHFAEDGTPTWVNIGDGCIEVRIMKDAPMPSVTLKGEILFSADDTDYKICSR